MLNRKTDIDSYVKSVRIRSYSVLYFPAFGLNMERYSVSLCIQSECGKIRTSITRNTDTFQAVIPIDNNSIEVNMKDNNNLIVT